MTIRRVKLRIHWLIGVLLTSVIRPVVTPMACMYIHYAVTIGVTTGCRLCILLVHVLTTGVTTGRHTVTLRPYVIPVCGMLHCGQDKQAVRRPPQYAPASCKLTFDLLTLKVVSESRATCTWTTSVPILVFLGLSILDLGPMYATDRQTSDAHNHLMLLP